MNDVLILVLLAIGALLVILFVPMWRMKRNVPPVLRVFREHNATSAGNAKTLDELGLRLPRMLDGILSRRDYKRYALKGLIETGIIEMTEDGKFFLSEERLLDSRFYKSSTDVY